MTLILYLKTPILLSTNYKLFKKKLYVLLGNQYQITKFTNNLSDWRKIKKLQHQKMSKQAADKYTKSN